MNLAIPRDNPSEMLLYIWKIIDLPFILRKDLLYRLSFELFLDPPEKVQKFINKCIEDRLLIKDDNQNFRLSKDLNNQLLGWQDKRQIEVIQKIKTASKIERLKNDISKDSTNFSVLINAFADKGTLNRSVSVSDTAFEMLSYDRAKGLIKSKVKGSKEESYLIEINTNKKIIRHNCHDFESRRAENKKFCKHLIKLFLLLKDKNENLAEFFLNKIAEDIDLWDFST
ncbi:MAG: hypothetical protein ACFFAB_06395 [Candidatus Heimdallarchaeota archaeon]